MRLCHVWGHSEMSPAEAEQHEKLHIYCDIWFLSVLRDVSETGKAQWNDSHPHQAKPVCCSIRAAADTDDHMEDKQRWHSWCVRKYHIHPNMQCQADIHTKNWQQQLNSCCMMCMFCLHGWRCHKKKLTFLFGYLNLCDMIYMPETGINEQPVQWRKLWSNASALWEIFACLLRDEKIDHYCTDIY